ncbi:DNA-directed RNA polymerase I subunit rpa49 [Ophidiomyces ophidiicola]|nr:DNA-directed RNA polymerase I subunit rpa49 [Ophidiomyces ophidiicola]KAI1986944.1 DNA-directed RNA polymerase I subunit rpa49 [Ophidiomyces ophidiicola]KAI1987431.1 DNA-directed RNA polymerase I subunit rpa49 [Ophidiomyces ophidiicola]KAI2001209.1 DNA-directed RNA polymerase I subunit rpa49 [Ophidiomyces ophidiicola]
MGHESPEKKRKRSSEKHDRPSKKTAVESALPPLKVQFIDNPTAPVPVIASTPGLRLPENLSLSAYTKPRGKRVSKTTATNSELLGSELLLQSSTHPKLDFIAKEGVDQLDSLWNHYVAIYDPKRNSLQLVEARKLTVRGCVREAKSDNLDEEPEEEDAKTAFSKRSALAQAFGTKQSRKAVQSVAENALLSSATPGAPSAAESALLSSMSMDAISAAARAQQEIQAAKPLPQPNLSATHPSGVYSIESLVPGGLSTLHSVPVRDWQTALANSEAILTRSRFVAHRVEALGKSNDKTQLQLLRFILILIEFAGCLKPTRGSDKGSAGSKKLPLRDELRQKLSEATASSPDGKSDAGTRFMTDSFIDSLRRKFVPQGAILSRNDITLLHTTICALSLHVPPASGAPHGANELATDPADLRDDLGLENQTVLQYFKELGCRVEKPRENEYTKWGVKRGKAEAAMKRIARLKMPVEFPKLSRGGRR